MEALKVEGLSKNFGGLQILRNISLHIEAGEKVAIIGPNGAGKTTLLNIITGELAPSSGRLFLFGQDITGVPPYRRVHIGLARAFQVTRLFYNLSVLDNIVLALQGTKPYRYQMLRPISKYKEILDKANELLELVNLWGKRKEFMRDVSYGEQRKMEIALSLASEPRVLLLDEPTAGLAIAEIPQFIDMIRGLAKNITLLFTAHDMDVVFTLADRVDVLYYGEFIARGTPKEVQAAPIVKEIYLGLEGDKEDAAVS